MVRSAANSVSKAEGYVTAALPFWNRTQPMFLSLYLYSGTMGPQEAYQIASDVSSWGPQYQIVRGDQFFCLIRQANGLAVPAHLCPQGQRKRGPGGVSPRRPGPIR